MPPTLKLEPSDSLTGQARLAALYFPESKLESGVRKVKRLFEAGRKVAPHDPPPVDDPLAMVEWHERLRSRGVFKHAAGTRYDAAIAKMSPAPVPAVAQAQPAPAPDPSAPLELIPEYIPAPDETAPAQMLKRLELEEATLHAELRQMRKAGKTAAEQSSLHARWLNVQELLGHQRQRVEKLRGLMDPAIVSEKVRRFFNTLPEAAKRILIRQGLPTSQAEETVRKLFERLPDEIETLLTAA